ncbi:MAG: fumarylacetoacetate hydrolase family protein [Deltaproteobacteria bacterium]|nr:fumarylacetoacetate hydrolase family protein [Deltaproteobacteria bacterium]
MSTSSARYLRFLDGDAPRWGRLEEGRVQPLDAAPWAGGAPAGEPRDRAGLALLAPATPTKIVCVGRNYAAHAAELGNEVPAEPLLFLKPPSSVVGPGGAIELPPGVGEVHHESELAVVVGRRLGPGCTPAEALEAAFALCAANDVTARALQKREGKFTRAKGFDTFCALGPELVTGEDPLARRAVRCRVNGELRQEGHTGQLIFDVRHLLHFVAQVMTLEPGDLLLTGTPPGVGPIVAGDRVEVEVEGVGVLENPVVDRAR